MTAQLDRWQAELSAEFPGWTIVYTRPVEGDRWWATRGGLVRERLDERGTLDAASPGDLRAKLLCATTRPRQASRATR